MRDIYPNELMHYGVLGMKWGVRRYQNPDGSLTPAGRTHYGVNDTRVERASKKASERASRAKKDTSPNPVLEKETRKRVAKKLAKNVAIAGAGIAAAGAISGAKSVVKKHPEAFEQTVKAGKDKPNISPAEKVTKESGNALNSAENLLRTYKKMQNNREDSPSKKMTDDELRKAINRMELERRYNSLSDDEISSGMDTAINVIEMAKDLAIGTGAVVGAFVALKQLKGG